MPDKASVRFVILAVPRTGSNMLCTLLNSHPQVLCHHELYNPADIFYALPLRQTGFSFAAMDMVTRDARPLDFLDQVWSKAEGHSHVGFKMTLLQNQDAFEALIKDKSVRKIVLKRKDQLATYVSRLIAEQRNIWEDYGEQPLKDMYQKVHVSLEGLRENIAINTAHYELIKRRLESSGQTAFYTNYEILNDTSVHKELLDFLHLSNRALTASSRRQNPEPLSHLIENYEELKEALSDTDLGEYTV